MWASLGCTLQPCHGVGGHCHHCSVQVQRYETEHEKFCDWLNDKKRDVGAFGPVPTTPDHVEEELTKLNVCTA